jgi:hypothetical protein
MVLVDSRGISRVPRYSGTDPASQFALIYRAVTVYGRSFQIVRLANWFLTRRPCGLAGPTTPSRKRDGLGCSAFARRYWRNHCCFLFLQVLRWFTSLRCLPPAYGFSRGSLEISREGLPHSDISGSKPVCGSPKLIAAYHVLRRLLAPRHSPYALSSLTIRTRKLTLIDFWLWTLGSAYSLWPAAWSLPASVPMHTACVWSEKTTVCRVFSCQRTRDLTPSVFGPWCFVLGNFFSHGPRTSDKDLHASARMVENTGLEPVTSWLQTRRSPS